MMEKILKENPDIRNALERRGCLHADNSACLDPTE